MYKIENKTTGEILESKSDKELMTIMKKNSLNLKDFDVFKGDEKQDLPKLILGIITGGK